MPALAAVAALLLGPCPLAVAQIDIITISSEGGISMSGPLYLAGGGKVVFKGERAVGDDDVDGVYVGYAGGGVSPLVEVGSPEEFLEIFAASMSESGEVGFTARVLIDVEYADGVRPSQREFVYFGDDPYGDASEIATLTTGLIDLNNDREVVFRHRNTGILYAAIKNPGTGTEQEYVQLGLSAFGDAIGPWALINNRGQVAFVRRKQGESTYAVVRANEAELRDQTGWTMPTVVLASGFLSIGSIAMDDTGRVVFVGQRAGESRGLFEAVGEESPVALALEGDSRGFSSFGSVAMSPGGQVAFSASHEAPSGARRSGIFRGFDPVEDKIVGDGDRLTYQGREYEIDVSGFGPRACNDAGQIAFAGSIRPIEDDEGGGDAGPASVRPSDHGRSHSGLFITAGTPDPPPDDDPSGDDEEDDPENTFTWINSAGGAFATAANWEPAQVPVRTSERADTARFNLGAAYTVATPEAATERLLVRGGDVTLNVGAYTVGGSDPGAPSVSVTRNGILRVTGGSLQSVHTTIGNGSVETGQTAEAHVFNAGTTWTNPGRMTVGGFSRGHLFVANGPTLTTGEARIGVDAHGEAIVGGADSFWDAGSLAVGFSHEGHLAIESGGSVEAEHLHVGRPGGEGVVTVEGGVGGAPSRLTVSDSLTAFYVGNPGGVGELNVFGGGFAEAIDGGFLAIGLRDGDSTGTGRVVVRGADAVSGTRSTLRLDPLEPDLLGALFVGWGGDGLLRIEAGGLVQCDSAAVANQDGSVGVAVIDGGGGGHESHWDIAGILSVGYRGFGDLDVTGGGVLTTDRLTSGGTSAGRGRISVTGVGSDGQPSRLIVNDSLAQFVIGHEAGEGELIVSQGGLVEAAGSGGFLGIGSPSSSAGTRGTGRVVVRGHDPTSAARSTLRLVPFEPELLGTLIVGWGGDGALRIDEGGLVQCESAGVSNDASAVGLIEVISTGGGAPSHLEVGAALHVGTRGPGQVVVEGGGLITTRQLVVGNQPGGHGRITVRGAAADGSPSLLQFGGDSPLVLGEDGGVGELRLEGGARVVTSDGTGVSVRAGEVSIQGADPVTGSRSALFLEHADAGRGVLEVHAGATVTVGAGGAVRSRTARIGGLGTGIGAGLVVVEGAGALGPSRWHAATELVVGAGTTPGSTGVLSVIEGGAVTIGDAEPEAYWVRIGAGGTLSGDGTIVAPGGVGVAGGVNNFAGTVAPGTSPGTLTIEGDYTQGAAGVLEIEIGGLAAGYDYDQLVVTGDITFAPGAKVRITFIDPNPDDAVAGTFVPRTGDVFSFLIADALTLPAGATLADVIEFANLPTGVTLDFDTEVVDGATVITAVTTAAPPAAGWRITAHPRSVLATAGTPTTFSLELEGAIGATYQWRRNGVDIPGATEANHTVRSPQRFNSGDTYSVVIVVDGVAVESRIATLAVETPPSSNARLLNLSTRALSLAGDDLLIPGFVISGSGTKRMLIRGVGPGLSDVFGIPGTLEDPRMTLMQGGGVVASNDDWGDSAAVAQIVSASAMVGAFPLLEASRDAVLLVDLPAGAYTVPTIGADGGAGIALVELYDADVGTPTATLVNISNRGFCGVGDNVMIPGFVVSSEGPKTVLVRVVGPTLATPPFNVPDTMADPKLTMFSGHMPILENDDWGDHPDAAHTASVAADIGAFALAAGSADAAFVVTLQPGSYTVVGSSAIAGATGVVLVEVYVVP